MNKQEILAKNKKDGLDEREQTVYSRSFGFGAVVVAVLCLAFSVYRAFHGEKFFEFVLKFQRFTHYSNTTNAIIQATAITKVATAAIRYFVFLKSLY